MQEHINRDKNYSFSQSTLAENLDVITGAKSFIDNVKKCLLQHSLLALYHLSLSFFLVIVNIVNSTYQSIDTGLLKGYLRGVTDSGLSGIA